MPQEMTAQPKILEPIYLVEVLTPQTEIGQIYSISCKNRGIIQFEEIFSHN